MKLGTFRKRGDTWRAEVSKGGTRESKTFATKREAQEWAASRETELATTAVGGIVVKTLAQVLERFRDEVSPKNYPERRFRMQDLVRYVAPRVEGGDRQRVRNGILRVLSHLVRAGSANREGGEDRGTYGLYWWPAKVPHEVVGKCHAECHNSSGIMRPQ